MLAYTQITLMSLSAVIGVDILLSTTQAVIMVFPCFYGRLHWFIEKLISLLKLKRSQCCEVLKFEVFMLP